MEQLIQPPKSTAPRSGHKSVSRELSDFRPIKLQLIEGDEATPGKIRVRGEFARADSATQNGRVYPRTLWEREVGRLSSDLKQKKVFGELDHPADGRTSLSRVSHVVTSLTVEDDGTVVGEAEILDTARGKDLKALLKSGCAVGVSSRGYGSTQTTDDGKERVQEDYRLATFDFVAEPADSSAYPETFFESKERKKMGTNQQQVTEGTEAEGSAQVAEDEVVRRVSAAVSEATTQVETQLRDEFAAKLPLLVSKVKADIREEVRAELLSDPEVAGAKVALEGVKALLRPFVVSGDVEAVLAEKEAEISRLRKTLAEKDLKMRSMEEEQDKLAILAKTTGYRYFLEKQLAGNADAGIVRAAIGDVCGYQNLDSLKARLESVQSEITDKREKTRLDEDRRQTEITAKVGAERARLEEQISAQRVLQETVQAREKELTGTVEKLNEALEKSMEAVKIQGLMLYAERKLTGHPKAEEIRSIVERGKFSTKDEIDAIIESVRVVEAPASGDDIDVLRARVRRLTRGGTSTTPVEEERPRRVPIEEQIDYNGLGLPLEQIKKLSGVGA